MKEITITIIFVLSVSLSALAQSDKKNDDSKAAWAVVEKLFDQMKAHNVEGIKELHTPESQLIALIKQPDGKSKVQVFSTEQFSKQFTIKRAEIKEFMYSPKTEIYGDLALISGRYIFFMDGKISHCGMNAFHLVRTEGDWKIAGISSTLEPKGCTEKEKKMKAD